MMELNINPLKKSMDYNGLKPSKIVFYLLVFIAVLSLLIPIVQFASYSSKYKQIISKSSNTLFEQAVLSTLNQEMESLWTEQGVYDFIQSLSRFNFSNATIGNPAEEEVYLPSGTTFKAQVINVSLGGIMTMNDAVSLIQSVESANKLVYIQPVHINNLKDFKQFEFKFYLGTNVPKPADRPLTFQYKEYGLTAMYKDADDAKNINKIRIPVFFDKSLWLGVFDEGKQTSISLYSR